MDKLDAFTRVKSSLRLSFSQEVSKINKAKIAKLHTAVKKRSIWGNLFITFKFSRFNEVNEEINFDLDFYIC